MKFLPVKGFKTIKGDRQRKHPIHKPKNTLHFSTLIPDVDEQIVVTRTELEAVCADIFQQAVQITKRLLEHNNITPSAISKVCLLGRKARIYEKWAANITRGDKRAKKLASHLGFASRWDDANSKNARHVH